MVSIGTPGSTSAKRVMLLGSGELGKEVAIELQRLGCEVIAVDRYPHAPAMQVAHKAHVINMLDEKALYDLIRAESPDLVVPEIEAIATEALLTVEKEGTTVVPTARAANLTMNRRGIRELVASELGVRTSPYRFVESLDELVEAVNEVGLPCVVKPVMSSSGKGQSTIKAEADIANAWNYALEGTRGGADSLIVEGFVNFDYEITLLTVRHAGGVSFCEPIGHRQEAGDYRESWQPQPITESVLAECQSIATGVSDALGGFGLFGMEFFIQGDTVYFSEVSPRPHDTGLVTLISQNLSEFQLHVRAILGLPIPLIQQYGPSASCPILVRGESAAVEFSDIELALLEPHTDIRLFGKPEVRGSRRMGVVVTRRDSVEDARAAALQLSDRVQVGPPSDVSRV
ncbi:MAG: formate-dependent phosphoribosylglycinamide formyltransferase [Gammaproteobacteria bacterium]|nr:formate-dependent phosphoribosylglycinamide formyltransferase [Gammaproteobacteria bacterium]